MISLEFLFAVLVLELTPGPNMAYLAALALARGRTVGLIAVTGVAAGLAVHAIVAALGVGVLIESSRFIYEALRWLGVGYLLFLGWEGWRTAAETSPSHAELGLEARSLFLRGFFSNVFNPKSILFLVSTVPGFIAADSTSSVPLQMVLYGLVYVGVATAIHASIVMLAAQLRPWLVEGPNYILILRILSLALVAVALWLLWATR